MKLLVIGLLSLLVSCQHITDKADYQAFNEIHTDVLFGRVKDKNIDWLKAYQKNCEKYRPEDTQRIKVIQSAIFIQLLYEDTEGELKAGRHPAILGTEYLIDAIKYKDTNPLRAEALERLSAFLWNPISETYLNIDDFKLYGFSGGGFYSESLSRSNNAQLVRDEIEDIKTNFIRLNRADFSTNQIQAYLYENYFLGTYLTEGIKRLFADELKRRESEQTAE